MRKPASPDYDGLKMAVIVVVLLMNPAWSFAADGQQFGRLFTTPEQRQRLQALRGEHRSERDKITEHPAPHAGAPAQSATADEEPVITFRGLIYRKDGAGMAWIDVQGDAATLDHRRLPSGESPGDGFVIDMPVSGQSVKLKPGQSYHSRSGAITDLGEAVP